MAPKSSNAIDIEIHFFGCGHGDTILIKLPVDKWILVDCNLPSKDGVLDRFFSYTEDLQINRLDYVFQTHPDYDHFQGMEKVLAHFTSNGRSIGTWCDAGINLQQIKGLMWPNQTSQTCYERLQNVLDRLDSTDLVRFRHVDDQTFPISPDGFRDKVEIVPLGPSAGTKRRFSRRDAKKLGNSPSAKLAANELSVVLMLAVKEGKRSFNILLSADANPDQLEEALDRWESYAAANQSKSKFDGVKVSHHGSIHSHSPKLCDSGNDKAEKIAIISAGTRKKLPNREVIKNYLEAGWKVLITTTRHRSKSKMKDRPANLVNQKTIVSEIYHSHDVKLIWHSKNGLSFSPKKAEIKLRHLSYYDGDSASNKVSQTALED